MKVNLKIPVIVLGLFISEFSYAASNVPFEAEVVNTNSFRLEIKQADQGVKLKLTDQQGQILYRESIQGDERYHKVFNLSTLPVGSYQLEVEYPTKIQILPIKIGRETIDLKESERIELFKPTVRQKDSRLSISMLNIQKVPLKVKVYDSNSDLVYQDELRSDLVIGKQYDMSQIAPGFYTVSMTSEHRTYSHSVLIE